MSGREKVATSPGSVPSVGDPHATGDLAPETSASSDVADFIARVKALPTTGRRGRLVFAMDATMSRRPTWDMALGLQAGMFEAVREAGGLEVQLVFFRGANECKASKWMRDADELVRLMTGVDCRGGYTQIARVLKHVVKETAKEKIDAVIYVGDAVEEATDTLAGEAGPLALMGVPLFLFQEGHDAKVKVAFEELARLTHGATCTFDEGSAAQLAELLKAVACYAQGGRPAVEALVDQSTSAGARRLLQAMTPDRRTSS